MLKPPTLDVYKRELEEALKKPLKDAVESRHNLESIFIKAGQFGGSRMVMEMTDLARQNFMIGMSLAREKYDHATRVLSMNRDDVIVCTRDLMTNHLDNVLEIFTRPPDPAFPNDADGSGQMRDLRNELILGIEYSLEALQQGFYIQDSATNNNIVHVADGATVNSIQQARDGAQQHVTTTINIGAIQKALEDFERALYANTEISAEDKGAIRAEIDTIRPQLGKQEPSAVILREALRSLRSITEGVAASSLMPYLVNLTTAAASLLG